MILVTGDIHGTNGFKNLRKLKKLPLDHDDYLIILGDFGVIWHDISTEYYDKNQEGLNWLRNNVDCSILFVDGNHENFNRLQKYAVSSWQGGKVHHINDQVTHLMRGQVFNIEGNSFFTMGGAKSIDKYNRKENISWWSQEEPSMKELLGGIENLEKVDFKVDYVLTHEAPAHIVKKIGYDGQDIANKYFSSLLIEHGLKFKRWYFGHYHLDIRINNFSCLFKDIEILNTGTLL